MDPIRVGGTIGSAPLELFSYAPARERSSSDAVKRAVDIVAALFAIQLVLFVAAALLVLNPLANPGPLLFRQRRMGQDGRPFMLVKFRTMSVGPADVRPHDAPLEVDRITPLGHILRKYRIDELPNFLNVLRGEMSVVGPRPDALDHAWIYAQVVPHYRDRYVQKPGITGLAQVRSGYADTARAVCRKARYDKFYGRRASLWLDLFILRKTVGVVLSGFGAK